MSNDEIRQVEINKACEKGEAFRFFDRAAIGATTKKYIFSTGAKEAKLLYLVAGSEDTLATIGIYEAPVITVPGSALLTVCMNRGNMKKTSLVTMTEDPTTTGNGTTIYTDEVTAEERDFCTEAPLILKANTDYMILITNPNVGPLDVWSKLAWIEI